MPPSPVFPDTIRTTLVWQQPNGEPALQVLHWHAVHEGPFLLDQLNELGTAIGNVWDNSALKGMQTTGIRLERIKVEDLVEVPYREETVVWASNGTDAGQQLPAQLSVCCTLRSGVAGRRGRGRSFVPGFTESSNNVDGTITLVTRNAVEAFYESLRDLDLVLDEVPTSLAVLSRADAVSRSVVTVTSDTRWDVQRRRANRRLI